MRKLICMATLLIILMVLPVCAHGWEWTLDEMGTLEITGSGPVEDFGSAANTPWHGKTVNQVVVHEGITELGDYAFRSCTKITDVTLPHSLVRVGVSAFEGCSKLKTVTFGTGLRTVEQYAFLDCTALTGVYISNVDAWCQADFVDYSSSPMYYAQALYVDGVSVSGQLRLGDSVTKIPKYAFYGCAGITDVYLPDTVASIESDAFTYCTGLTYVSMGSGLSQIGSAAFSYCSGLLAVSMADRVTAIGDYAFYNCTALKTAELSAGLKQLGQRTFYGCTSLESIHLPEGLETMGSYAFYGCTGLKAVTIPESLTVISAYAFRGCSGLAEMYLPETLSAIDKNAFYGCSSLKTLTIPKCVTTIGNHAFYNCTGLETICFNAANMADLKAGNNVFYKAGTADLTVTVGPAVTCIPAYLFCPYGTSGAYNPHITQIVFEEDSSCAEIGKYAFAYCKSLKKVVFSGAAPVIGDNAFSKVTAACLHPASWDGDVLSNYGGTLSWLALLVESADGALYSTLEEALLYSNRLRLLWNAKVDATLQADLYIDLNGYDLTGVIRTGDHKVFGKDSSTDGYEAEHGGVFDCDGAVPEVHCRVDGKRYLAVKTEKGYTFHRFYMGITHMTIRPGQQGVGFKAVFYGDEVVRRQIAATGYTLALEGFTSKDQWHSGAFESGATISLLIRNFDGSYGEVPLVARLCLRLTDGTVIESNSCTMTLRGLMEQLNQTPELLTDTQKQQIAQWVTKCPIMGNWKIEHIL